MEPGQAFTDPALIVTWIGDRAELDPQAGGVFSLDMGQVTARGAYITVDPPYRVAFSWGIPGSGTLPPGGSTVEVVLTPDGDGTMVVLTHRGLRPADIGIHRTGWKHRLRLLSLAAGLELARLGDVIAVYMRVGTGSRDYRSFHAS